MPPTGAHRAFGEPLTTPSAYNFQSAAYHLRCRRNTLLGRSSRLRGAPHVGHTSRVCVAPGSCEQAHPCPALSTRAAYNSLLACRSKQRSTTLMATVALMYRRIPGEFGNLRRIGGELLYHQRLRLPGPFPIRFPIRSAPLAIETVAEVSLRTDDGGLRSQRCELLPVAGPLEMLSIIRDRHCAEWRCRCMFEVVYQRPTGSAILSRLLSSPQSCGQTDEPDVSKESRRLWKRHRVAGQQENRSVQA